MRRIDALAIGFGVFIAGGAVYLVLQQVGLDSVSAGIWSQVLLISGLIGWVATYLFRFATSNMTYHQQLRDYTQSVIEKRWETMTPEERDRLLADLDELESSPETSSPETSSPETSSPKSSSDPC